MRYWKRTALIEPTPVDPNQTAFDSDDAYGFRDLVSVRSIVGLLARGVPLHRIRSGAAELRERFPELEPLPGLQAWSDAPRLLLHHDGAWMETDGQLVLDFVREDSPAAVAPLLDPDDSAARLRAARECFERGCALDSEAATWKEAIAAYQRAVEIDPGFADAHCNLGSLYFNQGQRELARAAFLRAIEAVPRHVEAQLNLGTLHEEAGEDRIALAHYRAALEADPLFPGLHVSMALVYEKLGLGRTALAHWRRHLQLEPQGSWAGVARQRIELAERTPS